MRRILVLVGIVVFVVALILALVAYSGTTTPTTTQIPAGQAYEISPNSVGSATLAVSWSGLSSTAKIYLVTGSATCPASQGTVVAKSGASGSFSASINSGTIYSLYACDGTTPVAVTVSTTISEISYGLVVAIVLEVVGAVLLVIGLRLPAKAPAKPKAAKKKAKEPPAEEPEATEATEE